MPCRADRQVLTRFDPVVPEPDRRRATAVARAPGASVGEGEADTTARVLDLIES